MTLRPIEANVLTILGLSGRTFSKVVVTEPDVLTNILAVHNDASSGEIVVRRGYLATFGAGVKSSVSRE